MKLIFIIVLVAFLNSISYSQNVGQKKDTLINYTDINGKKQGPWKKYYPESETVDYVGYFVDNKPVGKFTRYYDDGTLKAEIKYDKKDVARTKLYERAGGLVAEGNYVNQLRDSAWVFHCNGYKCREEFYVMGKYQGVQKIFNQEGVLIDEASFVDNKVEGFWKQYYVTGNIKFNITYKNGRKNGEYIIYNENGTVCKKGKYVDDLEEGPWQYNDDGGKLKYVVVYKKGEIIKDGGLMKERAEKLKKEDENRGKYVDPEKFSGDPENYFQNSRTDY